ncbi:LysR family transcriptional regulator [Maliponia aquimaris]|uniref:Nodulation protein D 2 n=1 Tax=Maliponia aquimaris TaxID=1673631 RepID=A0A238L4V1_9RHOB|nr:LysR family transcriptional regulator [Maliponia aquimaris]SMX50113.1 Nodulation protein D 2 [Maliponia aquimaris]
MNFATFDLNLLRVLDALFRDGSTVKAGARLGLSQPAVSGAQGRLRHALCDPLFVRQGNRLVPTSHAETLRDGLADELARIEALLAPPQAFDPATAEGSFRIAGSDFFAELLMPRLGALLSREAPGLRAQLVDLVPQDYVASLEHYPADLALIPDTPLPGWIAHQPLFRSPFVVIARAGHPALDGLEEGSTMPMDTFCALSHVLFSPEGNLSAMGDAALARVGRARRVAMTVPVFSGVCRVVAASELIALVPLQLARAVAASLGLRVFTPPMPLPPAQIVGIWHRRADSAPLARWMRTQVFALLQELEAPGA